MKEQVVLKYTRITQEYFVITCTTSAPPEEDSSDKETVKITARPSTESENSWHCATATSCLQPLQLLLIQWRVVKMHFPRSRVVVDTPVSRAVPMTINIQQ